MSERPVEELIGWKPWIVSGDKVLSWVTAKDPQTGRRQIRTDGAQVDDLAAWAISHNYGVSMFDRRPEHSDFEALLFRFGRTLTSGIGPTIRDALIAAVRKVAEQ